MKVSCSVMSNSWQLHGLYSPWNSPGQKTGVRWCSLLQGIFPTQGWNPALQVDSLPAEPQGKPWWWKEKNLQPRDYSTQKDLIQIQQRNQKLYRQANAKRIQLIQMNLFIKQISKSYRFQKSHLWLPKGKCRGSNKLGDWG